MELVPKIFLSLLSRLLKERSTITTEAGSRRSVTLARRLEDTLRLLRRGRARNMEELRWERRLWLRSRVSRRDRELKVSS